MKNKVSVVIPTYNNSKTLKRCIMSLAGQTLTPYEILIVDNASSDTSITHIRNFKIRKPKLKLRLFRNKRNLGVAGGRNKGIKEASKTSDYIFFFDHDMYADKNMLSNLVKIADKYPRAGIVTPRIYYWSDKKRIWSAGTGVNLWTGQVLFRGGRDVGQFNKIEEVQVAPAAMLVRKSALNKIRGFDEKIFAVWEDTDFSFRAREYGFKVLYAPDAVAYHDLSTDPKDEAQRLLGRGYWVGRNRVIFMKRWGHYYPFLFLFLPILSLYYLYLAVRYNQPAGFVKYLEGIKDGVKFSEYNKQIPSV